MKSKFLKFAGLSLAMSVAAYASAADLKVGFVTSLSGPGSSIGIPYAKGIQAAFAYQAAVGGRTIQLIQLDDASDPSTAARNARKLVDDEKVDVLIGTSGVPGSMAIAAVARESKTPMLAVTPLTLVGDDSAWTVTTAQPVSLMIAAVAESMKRSGVKTVGYIGFSDSWGDLVYDGLLKSVEPAGIKVLNNERYARTDASVTGQMIKLVSARPEAVMTGGSGTPGALPYLALTERGFRGPIYGTHALINADFVRVAGASAQGLLAPTGPVIVAEQLPASHPSKKIALDFRAAYERVHKAPTTDGFSAYAFDAWLVLLNAAGRVAPKMEPGSPPYRAALRDAVLSTKELAVTHGVLNFKPGTPYGADERARVMVKLDKGQWKLVP
ncbi:ABC transporter substrate-binding protein [Rhodoferax ferrireducens]|uniref:ABC transporter substrate-binding protein n=1 Tax=Rhodoferax ferrireducens TaxID=192843 RepID=UPI000E0DE544|nr:ABC transporter substrate-binding protein [Rhodoferax ferrireducens]